MASPSPPPSQDVVEVQLSREVAARSASFFQAASQLQGLRANLSGALDALRRLRAHIAALDGGLYSAAVGVAALQARKARLADALEIAKVCQLRRLPCLRPHARGYTHVRPREEEGLAMRCAGGEG